MTPKYLLVLLPFLLTCNAQCITESDTLPLGMNPNSLEIPNSAAFNFSVDFFQTLVKHKGVSDTEKIVRNIFGSPYSVWQVLTLAYFGSNGDTERELGKVLRIDKLGKYATLGSFKLINFFLKTRSKKATEYKFNIANRAYVDKREPVRQCMRDVLQEDLNMIDFLDHPDESRESINSWVAEETYGRIKDLIPAGMVDPSTRLALVNAVYFKGQWDSRFKPSDTTKELFYQSPNKIIHVDMMKQKGTFGFGLSEELLAAVLELPYKGEDISMFILLPPYIDGGLETIIRRMTPERIKIALNSVSKTEITVHLPKFKVEQTIDLQSTLQLMNVTTLFDATRANLSGFSELDGLFAGAAIHKSYVNVDEEGAEAAAATALLMFRTARLEEPERFVANHPFVYIIYDHHSEVPLFMGVMVDPNNRGA